jgi:hypothetical protein
MTASRATGHTGQQAPSINWGPKHHPRKADGGHSPIRYGYGQYRQYTGFRRTYVECECGTLCPGQGDEGSYRSHRRHQQANNGKR